MWEGVRESSLTFTSPALGYPQKLEECVHSIFCLKKIQ